MAILGIHTIIAQTSNMDRSVAFFRDVLGLNMTYTSKYWTSFDLGQQRLGLHPTMGETLSQSPKSGCIVGLSVDSLAQLRVTLEQAQATYIGEYHETPSGVVMDFCDPDFNTFQAIQLGTKMADIG